MQFVLDLCKWDITGTFDYTTIPATEEYKKWLKTFTDNNWTDCRHLLSTLINLNADIKWDTSPKAMIEATLLMEVLG